MDSSPVRILILADDEDDLMLTRGLLKEIAGLQFELEWVKTWEAGRRRAVENTHDVCLLDGRLLGPSVDLLRQLVAAGCRIPLILLADQSERSADVEALQAGAADYLIRGRLDPQLLDRSIRFAIERRRATEELKARVAELVEADRQKDEFLALLAHELRNPLAALAAAVELVGMQDDPANRDRLVGVLERQVRHLAHLVDDLLDVARLMRGKIQVHKQPVDLKAVVAQAVDAARPFLNAHKHELQVSMPAGPLPVEADAARLAQVFAHLLNNAAKFTRDGGNISIRAALADADEASQLDADDPEVAAVVVRIRDNGMGMAEDLVPRVFDLFVQGAGSLDRAAAGLGVGLTMVRRLVRLHGGSVSAQSEGPGRGSEFVVRLPLAGPIPAAAANPLPPAAVPPRAAPARTHRLLLVDDNVDTAETLAKLLRHLGQEVRTAYDGAAALETALSFCPEIILCDIGLPGITGYDVARQLRQQAGMDKALLIALTGNSHEEARIRCKDAGFDHYLVKPVGLKTLQQLLIDPASLAEDSGQWSMVDHR